MAINVNVKFGRKALPLRTQLNLAGFVLPDALKEPLTELQADCDALSRLYSRKVIDKQDLDAARVRVEKRVKGLRIKRVRPAI